MTKFIIALLLVCSSSLVFAENIHCSLSVNAQKEVDTEFTVEAGAKEMFIDSPDYRFFLSNKGKSKFELDVYDVYAPSRSYSIGYLRSEQDELSWAFWSRDALLETTCKLLK